MVVPLKTGYTAEGATSIESNVFPYNLTNVAYNLQWDEDEDSDNLPIWVVVDPLDYPDNFTFAVQTEPSYNVSLSNSGTSGDISLDFSELNFSEDSSFEPVVVIKLSWEDKLMAVKLELFFKWFSIIKKFLSSYFSLFSIIFYYTLVAK